jgi:hypothetical protein
MRRMDEPSTLLTDAAATPAAAAPAVPAVEKPAASPAADPAKPVDKPAEAKPEDKKDEPAGAPEAYAAFTMPEGVALDTELLGEAAPMFKALNLPQDKAQAMIDMATKVAVKTRDATTQAIAAQHQTEVAAWTEAARADKEFGGDKFNENLGLAKTALATFGTPELINQLNKSGLGNHPELIRTFVRIGQKISADGFMPGGKTTTTKTTEQLLYPNLP